MTRIIFGISGASGMPLASRVLRSFAGLPNLEIHLVISRAARQTILAECGQSFTGNQAGIHADDNKAAPEAEGESCENWARDHKSEPRIKGTQANAYIEQFPAHAKYDPDDFSAPFASGSWQHAGMVICPCSMSSLGAIAHGIGSNLIHRAADVCLKERRPLILVARETPLNLVHLRNMTAASEAGATIMPFAPAFYTDHAPDNNFIHQAMRQFAGRILDQMRIPHQLCVRWGENKG